MVHRNGGIYANGTQVRRSHGQRRLPYLHRCPLQCSVTHSRHSPYTRALISNYNQAAGSCSVHDGPPHLPWPPGCRCLRPRLDAPHPPANTYTDPSGTVWVSRTGSAWKLARDALHCRVYRNAAWTIGTGCRQCCLRHGDQRRLRDLDRRRQPCCHSCCTPSMQCCRHYRPPITITGVDHSECEHEVGYPTITTPTGQPWCAVVYSASLSLAAGDVMTLTMASSAAGTGGGTGTIWVPWV